MEKITVKGKGTVEFRLPNVVETYEMFGEMGLDPEDFVEQGGEFDLKMNKFKFIASTIKSVEPFLEKVDLKASSGEKVKDFDGMIKTNEFLHDFLIPISQKIMSAVKGGAPKPKKKS